MPPVIVDTSVWVQYFRVPDSVHGERVEGLIRDGEVVMVGPVLAEVLQGVRSPQEFEELQIRLAALPYLNETRETWTRVGELSFQLRQRGAVVALVDLLIASLALEHDCEVYTFDEHFQRVPGLRLYQAGAE